jgi:type II secretory pathway component PulK
MKHQRGTALILVLMLSVILGLLMLQMGLTAREQVTHAQLLDDRAEADLRAQSREAAMEYTLLTEPWVRPAVASRVSTTTDNTAANTNANTTAGDNSTVIDSPYAAEWNFYGKPFTVDTVTFQLQDVSGLVTVPTAGGERFVNLLNVLGLEPTQAARLRDELFEYQGVLDALRRTDATSQPVTGTAFGNSATYPLQSLDELRRLPDMTEPLFQRLAPLLTLYPTKGFDPMTAPVEVLKATLPAASVEGVVAMREAGTLNQTTLAALTGLMADDTISLSPGPALRLSLMLEHRGVTVRRDTVYVVQPYDNPPLSVWSRRVQAGPGAATAGTST